MRRARRLAFVLGLASASIAALPNVAYADDAAARAAFRKGVEHYDHKRWDEALEAFETAYREKPSPIIKQNIGLCHAKLGHAVAAATAFDEALDEGATTLDTRTKAAIGAELRELEKNVATLHIRAVDEQGAKVEDVTLTITVDGKALPPGAIRRPVRLEPGTHVVGAKATGYPDPPTKTLSLLAGEPVDATFELSHTPPAAPIIEHRLPDGTVAPTAESEERPKAAPPAYEAPDRRPATPSRWMLAATLGVGAQSLRLGEGSGALPGGARHSFFGAAIGGRLGYRLTKAVAAEIRGELGSLASSYPSNEPNVPRDSTAALTYFALTPMLRLATPGKTRFTVGTGLGLQTVRMKVDLALRDRQLPHEGSGVAYSWLLDAGMQFDLGPIGLEALLFSEVHGTSNARDDIVRDRMLLASPTVRYGLRLGLLFPL